MTRAAEIRGRRGIAGESSMYDDTYATCARTYAILLIYPGEIDPAAVTDRLGIEPSSWQRRGEFAVRTGRPGPKRVAPLSLWSLTSKGQVASRDSRRHVDWLLERVASKAEVIRSLQEAGCRMAVNCFWRSQSGHGGPTIPPTQMRRLAELDIELWFDFYDSIGEEAAPTDDAEPNPPNAPEA